MLNGQHTVVVQGHGVVVDYGPIVDREAAEKFADFYGGLDKREDRQALVVMRIDGHDWRPVGGGYFWETPEGCTPRWEHLKQRPPHGYMCLRCGVEVTSTEEARPCHELWADKHGFASWSGKPGDPVYIPQAAAPAGSDD